MLETIEVVAEYSAGTIEILGVLIIAALSFHALSAAMMAALKGLDRENIFKETRLRLGHGILLGLELLVAADIIRTVAVEFTFQSVGVLATIVIIRTFLSITLELELTGRWPWQKSQVGGLTTMTV